MTVDEMRKQLNKRIENGLNNSDSERLAQWEKIPCAGKIPMVEEWLEYMVKKVHGDGSEKLLRRYIED